MRRALITCSVLCFLSEASYTSPLTLFPWLSRGRLDHSPRHLVVFGFMGRLPCTGGFPLALISEWWWGRGASSVKTSLHLRFEGLHDGCHFYYKTSNQKGQVCRGCGRRWVRQDHSTKSTEPDTGLSSWHGWPHLIPNSSVICECLNNLPTSTSAWVPNLNTDPSIH